MLLNQTDTTEHFGVENHTSPSYDTTVITYSTSEVTTHIMFNTSEVTTHITNSTSEVTTHSSNYAPLNTVEIIRMVVSVIAIIGNSLTFCICMKKSNRKKSFMMYLAALAFFDTLNSINYIKGFLCELPNFCLSPELHCKLVLFIFDSSAYISSWLIVAISLERAISTKIPHHVAKISSRRFGIKTISIFIIIALILNSHCLYGWTGVIHESMVKCYTIPGTYTILWAYFRPFLNTVFYSLIPGTIIILCNTVMVKAVFASAKIRGTISDQTAKRNRELMIVAVLVSVSFVVLTSPFTLLMYINANGAHVTLDLTDETLDYIYDIAVLMTIINHAINFFLYVVSGSRFRQQLKELLLCKDWCKN